METTQTPVDILQELIAMHTTRKEACEKMMENAAARPMVPRLKESTGQSDRYIAELMGELSQFGDAVQAEVNRDNEFHTIWKDSVTAVPGMDLPLLLQTFERMESSLKNSYTHFADADSRVPVTLADLLARQAQGLAKISNESPQTNNIP